MNILHNFKKISVILILLSIAFIFSQKSYGNGKATKQPKDRVSALFARANQEKSVELKLSQLLKNPKNNREYYMVYSLPYSFAARINKDRITVRVVLENEVLGTKEILVKDLKKYLYRKSFHRFGFIELKNNKKIDKIFIVIKRDKQTKEERIEQLVKKKFMPKIIYAEGDSKSSITKNIGLSDGEYGFRVDWFSDHPNITKDGMISRLPEVDSMGAMVAELSKDYLVTNKAKKIKTNTFTTVVLFTNLIVKGIDSKGLNSDLGDVLALNETIVDVNKGAIKIQHSITEEEEEEGEEVEKKIYLKDMKYEDAFPFADLGKVYFSPNKEKEPGIITRAVALDTESSIIKSSRLVGVGGWDFYSREHHKPYFEIPFAADTTFVESLVSLGTADDDYAVKINLNKKGKRFVCSLAAHESTVGVLNQLLAAFGVYDFEDNGEPTAEYFIGSLGKVAYKKGKHYGYLEFLNEEAARLQPDKFGASGLPWNRGFTTAFIKAKGKLQYGNYLNHYRNKINFLNEWNTSAKFTDYTLFKVEIYSDNGQTVWQSGEMKQGMLKQIDIEVKDMNYIVIKVLALGRGDMNHPRFKGIEELTPDRGMIGLVIRSSGATGGVTDLMLRDKEGKINKNLLSQTTTGDFVIWGDAYIEYIHKEKDGTVNKAPSISSN